MNLREQTNRIKEIMGLKEDKPIYNLDLIELGGQYDDYGQVVLPYEKEKTSNSWIEDSLTIRKWYDQEVQEIKAKYPGDMDKQWLALQVVRRELQRREENQRR